MKNIIKLNDTNYTKINTDDLLAVGTDMRVCKSPKRLGFDETMAIIDCQFKGGEQIALKYDTLDLESHDKDFELLANLEHVTVYFK